MKIAIAADTAGAPLAEVLARHFAGREGLEVTHIGLPEEDADFFYADLSDRVCQGILSGLYDRAILVCGTGIGVCLSANKVPGIRAAQTHDTYSAERAALSNNAQVITMGARVIGAELAKAVAQAYLSSHFDPHGTSARNVRAIDALDEKYHAKHR
ncbi:putative sugar phosphate isomerase YwlF [compost metagenome]|uniref:D-erythrulose-4-phosphate isomerase n=1 Tax=Variovorax boronicumulans TaxID=436515 RepID=UPI00085C13EC|nr:RpiB/LacA/LacB family sugar-phosphate isomerase [Variovorax boronicumulans]OEZ31503.1 ribose 5-phosphate isomerase [Variovorax boronicumulans]PBI89256.1 putative sugar phosphate isomerase YwlF [Variovorax boronicumulans]GER17958.1 RpiB/LacA/LacB family sugar-phosphate isomerase [Variovorax boronicumulans]